MNWDDKSTNQILLDIKQMELKHEALKAELLAKYDELEQVEREYQEANKTLKNRLSINAK